MLQFFNIGRKIIKKENYYRIKASTHIFTLVDMTHTNTTPDKKNINIVAQHTREEYRKTAYLHSIF